MSTQYPPFLNLAPELRDPASAGYHILPVPFDATSTFRKGADRGPSTLLEVSDQLEEYDIETNSLPCKAGIYVEAPVEAESPQQLVQRVQNRVRAVFDAGRVPIVLGGEHSVSVGAAWAAAEHFDDLTVVQLDAHSDLRQSYHGSPFNHACVMARIREKSPVLQAGIRSMAKSELEYINPERMFYAHEIHEDPEWIKRLCSRLSSRTYLTIDLDVFDPSIMPSTGTPQPGGLSWYTVLKLIRSITEKSRLVGFDIVELCPDGSHASPMLAAKLLYKTIAYMENIQRA
ncbi:agmatinase [Marispirochaeta sp.]|uniref:agmatinase n=1 Tax=Marispirochaeta sp. TaxID=2038653 RepID=UPI0029C6EF9A|nr:agmatinase [Marispirochaeta sp.]